MLRDTNTDGEYPEIFLVFTKVRKIKRSINKIIKDNEKNNLSKKEDMKSFKSLIILHDEISFFQVKSISYIFRLLTVIRYIKIR